MVARGPGYGKKVAAYYTGIRYVEHQRTTLDKNRAHSARRLSPLDLCVADGYARGYSNYWWKMGDL